MYIDRTKLEFRINPNACPHKPIEILAIIPQHMSEDVKIPELFGAMSYKLTDIHSYVQKKDLLTELQPEHARALYEALKQLFDPNRIPRGSGDDARCPTIDCVECVKSLEQQHKEACERFQKLSRLVSNYVTVTIDRKQEW